MLAWPHLKVNGMKMAQHSAGYVLYFLKVKPECNKSKILFENLPARTSDWEHSLPNIYACCLATALSQENKQTTNSHFYTLV